MISPQRKKSKQNIELGFNGQDESTVILQTIKRIDGQEIVKKYSKCGLLGKGGFANCYITESIETKRKSATKIVMKQQLKSHRTRLRLANQIKLHKTLHHPNVVQFYHCFEDKDNVYIFLQLCMNQSLNQLIRIRSYFITPQIQSFLYGIVNGVKYIHSQKIIHRDLKLGNIFIDQKFNVKIGDFGLATKLQFKNQCKRTVCGTPNYIAPQVLQGKGYHFQVDIWSIGVILYTLYFGIPPFQTEEANTTYQKIRQCSYVIPKTMNTPNQAISLIQKILVSNPSRRPTLDDILNSDFMRLGQGILKQLPPICSKKAPTKRDLTASSSICGPAIKKQLLKTNEILTKQYVTTFKQLLQNKFYYKLANYGSGIFQNNQGIIYKKQKNYFHLSFDSMLEQQIKDHDNIYLLMGQDRKFNLLDDIINIKNQVFVRKVQKLKKGWLIRLSNQIIQLLVGESNFVIIQRKLWQIQGKTQRQISMNKILSNNYKSSNPDIPLLKKILQQFISVEQCSKQNKTEMTVRI